MYYTYELDELGRTTRVSGELRLDEAMRNPDAQLEAGWSDRLQSDDGGHLIAAEFGGSGEWINLVAMDAETNRWGEYRDLEQELRHHLESGRQVYYENNIIWDGEKISLFGARNEVVEFNLIFRIIGYLRIFIHIFDLL